MVQASIADIYAKIKDEQREVGRIETSTHYIFSDTLYLLVEIYVKIENLLENSFVKFTLKKLFFFQCIKK